MNERKNKQTKQDTYVHEFHFAKESKPNISGSIITLWISKSKWMLGMIYAFNWEMGSKKTTYYYLKLVHSWSILKYTKMMRIHLLHVICALVMH